MFPDSVILTAIEKYKDFEIEIYQCKEIKSLIKTLELYKEIITLTQSFALPEIFFNGELLPDSENIYNTFIN